MIGGPSIVRKGLILEADWGNKSCYVTQSTSMGNMAQPPLTASVVVGTSVLANNNGGVLWASASGYANFGTSDALWAFSTPTFTYGAWFYFDGTSQTSYTLSRRNDSPFNQWSMGISNDATGGGNGTNWTVFVCPDAGYPPANAFNYDLAQSGSGWYYGVAAISSSIQNFYINGVLVGQQSQNWAGQTFVITGKPLAFGAIFSGGTISAFFKSMLAIAHVYNRTLTDVEVKRNFDALKGRFGRT